MAFVNDALALDSTKGVVTRVAEITIDIEMMWSVPRAWGSGYTS